MKDTLLFCLRLFLLSLVLPVLAACAHRHPAPVLPAGQPPSALVTAFASLPVIEQMKLSPSGRYIAFLQNDHGKIFLVTQLLENKNEIKIAASGDNQTFHIRSFTWVGDERLLVGVAFPSMRDNIKTLETRLLTVARDGAGLKNLIERNSWGDEFTRSGKGHFNPQFQDDIVAVLPDDPQHVLLALDSAPGQPDVYKVDVVSGERSIVQHSTSGVNEWLADQNGAVRAGIAGLYHQHIRIIVKPSQDDDWRTLTEFDDTHGRSFMPIAFDADPNRLYGIGTHQGRKAVYRWHVADPQAEPELMAADADYDVEGQLLQGHNGHIEGVVYAAGEQQRIVYWDAAAERQQMLIDTVLPERRNLFVNQDKDGQHLILLSSSPTQPPQFYLFNKASNRLRLLADTYPNIHPSQLMPSKMLQFKARDGLPLQAIVTLPHRAGAHALPLVVLPHGGPTSRDSNDFDYWRQFIANQGYAVMQINFRGSAGYGNAFMAKGFKRWGLEMQDDIEDGVRLLVRQGIADAQKVCIVGGSYGGYAALMGIVKTPDLYRCAISFAGVADLPQLLSYTHNFLGRESVEKQLGGWWSDHSRLRETSPALRAEQIRTPLLLVHGAADRTVPVKQSQTMADALHDAGFRDYQYLELPFGDHVLSREQDRVLFFGVMEQFLAKHLKQ